MRRILVLIVFALVVLPTGVFAQSRNKTKARHSSRECCWGNRFSLEPYGGALKDPYDASTDDENTSVLAGVKLGYLLGARTRLIGNVAYTESDNVANANGLGSYFVYDNTWVFTTGGAEFDVVPGRTSASVGLQVGAAWRRVDLDGQVGTPIGAPQADAGFSAYEVVIPSLTLRHRLTSRATISVGLHDNIFDVLEGPAQHGVGATLGVSFR